MSAVGRETDIPPQGCDFRFDLKRTFRREVADVLIDDAEQRGDGPLVGGDRIMIAHFG